MNSIPESQIFPPNISTKSKKLEYNDYVFIGDDNPERIYRQRTTGKTSGVRLSFRTQPPIPNLLLSSKAYIKYTFTLTKLKDEFPAVPENFEITFDGVTNGDVILTKPFMAIANATTEASLSINGKGITYRDPRYWQKYMGQLFCPEEDIKKYFSTCGGSFPENSGAYEETLPFIDIPNGSSGDNGFDAAADQTFEQYVNAVGAVSNTQINFYEPLYIGPFNWGFDIKDRLPKHFWGAKMSNLIPYVRDINYEIVVNKLAANCFYYHYGQTSVGFEPVFLVSSEFSNAELVLQWIKPKDLKIEYEKPFSNIHGIGSTMYNYTSMTIPSEVKLQSWNLNHKTYPVNSGNILNDGAAAVVTIPVENTYQIPSYILMFATTDKDNENYQAFAATFSDNIGANPGTSFDVTSLEANPVMTALSIDINTDKDTINNRYDSRELYNITLKNSKKDYPYDFAKYLGGRQRRANYPGQMCVLLSPEDLNIPMTTGRLNTDFTFAARINLRAETGHYIKGSAANLVYRFHVIFLYDKYYMSINNKGEVDYRYESVY